MQKALLTNYVSSVHESIAFPLIKHSSDSYLKYLDVFPFWKLRNWFLNAEVTRFQKQTHAALKSDERQAKVLIRIDSGQRFQLTLLQLQQFLPTIHDLLMNQQPDSGNTFKIHLAQLSFHWMSTYMSCVRDPNYVISKWTVAYEDFLCQLDLSLAFGCSEMAEFWYNSFSYMVPTLAGKLWLKMHTIRRFRLFTSVSAIRKALNNKFEQFTLDPLFMQISAYELSNWLIERSLGVSE